MIGRSILLKLAEKGINIKHDAGKLKFFGDVASLTAADKTEIVNAKQDIIDYLEGRHNQQQSIQKADSDELVLSFAQQRLWFIDNLQGGSPEYNMPMAFEVSGRLDLSLVAKVFNTILLRHEVLRSVYFVKDGQTEQHIRPMADVSFAIACKDLRGLKGDALNNEVKALVEADINQSFDLANDLMLRVSYLQKTDDSGVMIFNMHHIASDGWSMEVLTKEFFTLYHAFSQNQDNPLPPLSIQYADYAHWQRQYLEGEVLEGQLKYWEKQLDELPAVHSLPLDYPRPATKQHQGANHTGELAGDTAKQLLALAKTHQLTPFMLLHGALSLLLSRHANSNDIVIGTPVANRLQAELKPLIGFFVNTLVLRVDTAKATLAEYFAHVRQVHLDAQSNQDVPFEQLVERLKAPRSTNHSPLFQIMLTTNSDFGMAEQGNVFSLPDVEIKPFQSDLIQAKFDLNIALSLSDKGVGLHWNYDTSLFSRAHIEQLNQHLCRLLQALATAHAEQAPHALELLSQDEIEHLAFGLNDTQADYPKQSCIHQLFERQAEQNPEHIAVTFEGEQLSYGELNQKANQLARYLRGNHQVKPDTLVGICLERSVEMVIAIVAILKAGGAYVPLDPSYPKERLNYMLEDGAMDVVLSQSHLAKVLTGFNGTILALDGLAKGQCQWCAQCETHNLTGAETGLNERHLAYVIYTSGSTGQPKGVMVEHQALMNRIHWMNHHYGMTSQDKVLQKTPYSFDVSVWEFVWTLAYGAELVVAKPEGHKDPEYLCQLITAQRITKLHFVPSMLGIILDSDSFKACTSLEQVFCSGEALQPSHVQQFRASLPNTQLHNLYGPTEAAIDVSYWDCSGDVSKGVPIGKPIDNIQLLILDAHLNMVPEGAVGELHIGGDGLARGYLNRDELTAERFIANPFFDSARANSSPRLYKTGDLARLRHDGEIEYQGRTDHQVKIRGLRIELGEVETQLSQLSAVDSALVMAKEVIGSLQLVAYVKASAAASGQAHSDLVAALKAELGAILPDHMVPNIIMVVDSWPLTPNGKVDRKALPIPDGAALQGKYVAPQSEAELTLADIWAGLLNMDAADISATANFFDLGGHSLLSIRLVSEIRLRCQVEIAVQSIFDNPTLQGLALVIAQGTEAVVRPPLYAVDQKSDKVVVSFAQQRLWFIDKAQGGSLEYNMPVTFEVKGQLDMALVARVFDTILTRHEVLRTVYLEQDGQTLQHIRSMDDIDFEVTQIDLSNLSGEALESEVMALAAKDVAAPFDLANDVMLRVSYVKRTEQSGLMIFNMHHIASDGWSVQLLIKEFFTLCEAYYQGKANPLPPLSLRYSDYAYWQRDYLEGEVLEGQLAYWEKQLDDLPAMHSLVLDYPRPAVKKHQGMTITSELSDKISQPLLAMAKAHKLTPFMLLHGALSLLLSKHSNSHDIVVGTPVANRMQAELEPLIGFFVNTIVLRVDTEQSTLAEYWRHIRQVHLDAQSNQDVPFEQLVERLKVPRSTAYSPLFQIMLMTNTDYGVNRRGSLESFRVSEAEFSYRQAEQMQAKFDLDVDLSISEEGLGLRWTFDPHLFIESHISVLNDHMCRLLSVLAQVNDSELALSQLNVLADSEVERLAFALNATAQDYDKSLCIHQLIAQQAAQHPEHPAVHFEGRQLSYGELNHKANQLARYLKDNHQVGPDTLVGLCLERSLEMVIAIVATLKAGGAYVPLDPSYPQERLSYMLEDAAMDVVLSQHHLQPLLSNFKWAQLMLDGFATGHEHPCSELSGEDLDHTEVGVTSAHLAYVIYTSGSTGQPKGVMVEHQALFNRIHWMHNKYGMSSGDKVLQKTPFSFDVSVWEFVWTLAYGGQLVVAKPEGHKDPDYLCRLISEQQITKLHFVPSMLGIILENARFAQCHSIAQVFCSGEALQSGHVQDFNKQLPNAQLHNLYGPTEAAIDVSFWDCSGDVSKGVPIGRPIDNIQLMILDSHLNLVPEGAVGELHIGGDGLARGYLNRDELTAERFIANPFYDGNRANSSKRLYKTGDLARLRSDGEIEYQGRTDHQVKIRGLRIELGEIETQLSQLAVVDSALVMAQDVVGSLQLVAYVKPAQALQTDERADYVKGLKASLGKHLPDYMVPDILMVVDNWPLTPNGKVDRKALPAPEGLALQCEYVAPSSETEKTLVEIWSSLFAMAPESISATASFFELGGHSLMCVRMVSEVRARCEVEISVQSIFDNPILQALAVVIDQGSAARLRPPIHAHERHSDTIEVSFAQQRLWFIDNLQGGAPEYNMPMIFAVKGELDLTLVSNVFNSILARHEVLRTVYLEKDGQTLQRIRALEDIDFALKLTDLTHLRGAAKDAQVKTLVEADLMRPFDLANDVMLRVNYLKTDADAGVMIFNMHHIASDGWSMEVLIKEFFALYSAYSKGLPNPLPTMAVQYGDYALWQRDYLAGEVLEGQLDYWAKQLDEAPVVHSLPLDKPRPAMKQHQGAVLSAQLPGATAQTLLNIARNHKLTPFMLLHGALAILLGRHANSKDIVIGTPVANRLQPELEPLIGFFVNTLVLRVNTAHQSLAEFLAHVRAVHLGAQSHQDVPFEQLVERLKVPRSTAHSPLFQIMLTTNTDYGLNDDTAAGGYALPGLDIKPYHSDVVQAKFDLTIDMSISEQGIGLSWTYDVSLFDGEHIQQLNDHLCRLLDALAKTQGQGDSALSDLTMLTQTETDHLRHQLNQTQADYANDLAIHQLFERCAEQTPDSVALAYGEHSLSYRQLNEKANQLAHYLKAQHNIGADTLVGVCAERSIELVVAILAILKSGGAYVPLDPSYPQERIAYMVKDAALDVVLSQTQVQNVLGDYAGHRVSLDGLVDGAQHNACVGFPVHNLSESVTSSQLAYVIYTSGSTGQPKGVMIEHQALVNTICDTKARFDVNEHSAFYQSTSIGFDAASWVIFMSLCSSAQLVLSADNDYQAELSALNCVTHLMMTPSMLAMIEPEGLDTVKCVIVGGEACDRQLADKWQTKVRFFNAYGPTEVAICSSAAQIVKDMPITIGKPNANVQYLVLDSDKRLVPMGVVGELYIGGDGLARGYLNQSALTNERFIDSPFDDGASRLYASGDLVRYLPDGNLAFVGRIDDQVKIRGFRIELGEIENQLAALELVDSAVVNVAEIAASQQLVGYVKSTSTLAKDDVAQYIAAVKTQLSKTLPAYMVPGIILLVEDWPITPNGKIDKKALPAPDSSALFGEYVAPKSETENVLVDIWADLLKLDRDSISTTADFFELGGHSLLIIRLISAIKQALGLTMDVQGLYQIKDIQELAQLCDSLVAKMQLSERLSQHSESDLEEVEF